jgi:hypothetical protein
MKKSRITLDISKGFVFGIAIDYKEIQFGFIAWILIIKFKL